MKLDYFKKFIWRKSVMCLVALTILISGSQAMANAFAEPPNDWTLLIQKDGITVSYKLERCNEGQRILFQIQNKTSTELPVAFECKISTKGNDIIIPSLENTVGPNSTIEGSCADKPFQSTFIALPKDVSFKGIVITIK